MYATADLEHGNEVNGVGIRDRIVIIVFDFANSSCFLLDMKGSSQSGCHPRTDGAVWVGGGHHYEGGLLTVKGHIHCTDGPVRAGGLTMKMAYLLLVATI